MNPSVQLHPQYHVVDIKGRHFQSETELAHETQVPFTKNLCLNDIVKLTQQLFEKGMNTLFYRCSQRAHLGWGAEKLMKLGSKDWQRVKAISGSGGQEIAQDLGVWRRIWGNLS